jgi:hypothetical protein
MYQRTTFVVTMLAIMILVASSTQAGLIGEAGISAGGVFPQGNFNTYADAGPTFNIRANFHIPQAQMISGYVDLGGSFFQSDTEDIYVFVEGLGVYWAKKNVNQYNLSLHAGLQLGSDTRRGAIRPRAVFAPGLYFFNTQTTATFEGDEEPFIDESNAQLRFGWRGVVGTDVFFTTKWGLSFEFVFDQVINLHHDLGDVSKSARFHSFMLGVVFPMK